MTNPKDDAKLPDRAIVAEAAGGALGALSGAGLGAIAAGPVGAIAGAVVGAAMGASTGWAHESASREEAKHDEELDQQIGVDGGDIGASTVERVPGQTFAPSAESAGASSSSGAEPSEGPIPPAD